MLQVGHSIMTPEEQAKEIVSALWLMSLTWQREEYVADAIHAAVAKEREACARLVEQGVTPSGGHGPHTGETLRCCAAAAIRART